MQRHVCMQDPRMLLSMTFHSSVRLWRILLAQCKSMQRHLPAPADPHRVRGAVEHAPHQNFTISTQEEPRPAKKKKKRKTYNTGYSLVVTDPTTNPALSRLTRGERTG